MSEGVDALIHFVLLFSGIGVYVWFSKRTTRFLRLACSLLIFRVLFDGLAAAIMFTDFLKGFVVGNLFIYHLLTPVQYSVIALMYCSVIHKRRARNLMRWSILEVWLILLAISAFLQPLSGWPNFGLLFVYVHIVAIVLYFFGEVLNSDTFYDLKYQPTFWISIGLLLYSGMNVFVHGIFGEYIGTSHPLSNILYTVSSLLNYLLFLCFIIAFILNNKSISIESRIDAY